MANAIEQQAAEGGLPEIVSNAITACFMGLEKRRTYRRVYRELSSLTDYELGQLRISRSSIHTVAWDTAKEQ